MTPWGEEMFSIWWKSIISEEMGRSNSKQGEWMGDVHREQNFAVSYISMNTLTSSKILWINCGVTVKYSRYYAETVCKDLFKNIPHLSQCFHHVSLSLQVGVKITDSSTWLGTSQLESCSFRWLPPSECPMLELDPKWRLYTSPSLSHLQVRITPWAWGWTAHRGEEVLGLMMWGRRRWRRPFYPLGSPHHSLSLTELFYLSFTPHSFYASSSDRHLPFASKPSPTTMLPAIALNSFLAFWDFACFLHLIYFTSLMKSFNSGWVFFCYFVLFLTNHYHSEPTISDFITGQNKFNSAVQYS